MRVSDVTFDRQLLFENTFHLGTGVMFPEFMLYNLEMENDERVVEIKVNTPYAVVYRAYSNAKLKSSPPEYHS